MGTLIGVDNWLDLSDGWYFGCVRDRLTCISKEEAGE